MVELVRDAMDARKILKNDRLSAIQRRHAGLLIFAPALGTLALVLLVPRIGITLADVAIFALFYVLSIVGITVGFHRLFAHRSFQSPRWIRHGLGALGSMAMQGTLTFWVATHRRHHSDSDGPLDPHSPHSGAVVARGRLRGFWHAQLGWALIGEITSTPAYARDLLRDPVARRINRNYFSYVLLGLALPGILGYALGGTGRDALAGFLWGGPVRIFVAYHATSLVNSAGHLWGARDYATGDESTNLGWLAVLTLGEGWHNNHHAYPRSAFFGHRPRQIDLGGSLIGLMGRFGLATAIVRPARYKRASAESVKR